MIKVGHAGIANSPNRVGRHRQTNRRQERLSTASWRNWASRTHESRSLRTCSRNHIVSSKLSSEPNNEKAFRL